MVDLLNDPSITVEVESLAHHYRAKDGPRPALRGVSFSVRKGEVFGLLGPNGSGKTTLFKILSTLLRPASGRAAVCGADILASPEEARRSIGVVFQNPALDKRLTVEENLRHQGHLYGLSGGDLTGRIAGSLERFGVAERGGDLVSELSGGLKRRVELAKGMLHGPAVLILDEPSTGLDPGARLELWARLKELSGKDGVTVLLTTHWMEEAERCDRLGILSEGKLVAEGTPAALRSEIGGDVLTVETDDPLALAAAIRERFGWEAAVVEGTLRLEREDCARLLPQLAEAFGALLRRAVLSKPSLEDVFLHKTGHAFSPRESRGQGS
ncbi:MAG: ABC transporter ATP-binding protein [Elusimicrobiota bacterium]